MSDNTSDMLREQLEGTRDGLTELWGDIDAAQADDTDHDELFEALQERPLEIVWRKGSPFEVLLSFGGPNVWIEADARYDDYVLHGAWGGERATLRGESITRTGEYFREMVEESGE